MAKKLDIGGELHSVATDHKVADASEIKDISKGNKSQAAFNDDVDRHEVEIHGTGGIDSRLTDVEQIEQIVLDGGEAQIAQGSDFTNPDATKRAKIPTVGAIVDGLNDGIYDVSKRNPTGGPNSDGKFTLDYILDNANTLIPIGWRHGGMTISFVQSSDNKYVQYRLEAQSFTTSIIWWKEVDYAENIIKDQIRPLIYKLTGFSISAGKWMEGANYNSAYYPISNNDTIIIEPTPNKAYITILDDIPTPINGASVNFAIGYSGYSEKSVASTIDVPNNGKYLVFLLNAGVTDYTPSKIIINGVDILKSIQKVIEDYTPSIDWSTEIKPFIQKSTNLFDNTASDITYGSYIQGGNLNTDAGYNVSGYIAVSPSNQYSHKVYPYFGSTANRVSCYDKDKNYLGNALGVVTDGINVFTPLAGTTFVRVNIAIGDMDSYMFIKGTTYPNNFIPFGIYTNNLDVNRLSPLWGKKLCCDGDSIMHGAAQGGVSNGGFAKPIADRFGMVLQNIAVPGGTIRSNTYWDEEQQTPRHWICDSLATLDTDGDYYIFEGGVNDVGSSAVMGTISWGYTANLDTTTFCGAMEKCCKTLVETFKGKKCGFVFVHRIWQPTDTLASSFFENQKAILKKWGIPFIDLMELAPALNLIDDLKNTYTNNADGWHPNKFGYAIYYVPKIISWLESL